MEKGEDERYKRRTGDTKGGSKQVWCGCKMRKLEHVINLEGGGEW